ncbi:MAG: hemolysin family protein [Pseudomonadota bacterium]
MDARHSGTPGQPGETSTETPAGSSGATGDAEAEPGSQPGPSGAETDATRPKSTLLRSWLRRATGPFRSIEADPESEEDTDGELGAAMRTSSPAERAMVANILRLRDLRVEDVMTPRADIVAVPADASLEEVTAALSRGSLSRVPVYHETLDDPLGFVHLKDLALTYGVGCASGAPDFLLRQHLRTALFVPPSMRIAALMQKMQAERVHMALVIDEFGGVDGLVTIEDLVEQIVGDIEDEHDAEERAQWRSEAPGIWVIDARADIAEFSEAAGLSLVPEDWDEEADTLGGLVFMMTGRVPTRGEIVTHPMGHEIEVLDADPRRIRRLRLTVAGVAGLGATASPPRQAAE